MNNAVVDMMQEISKRVDKGEKNGVVECPYCGGEVHYIYSDAMAMRAKCNKCEFSVIA